MKQVWSKVVLQLCYVLLHMLRLKLLFHTCHFEYSLLWVSELTTVCFPGITNLFIRRETVNTIIRLHVFSILYSIVPGYQCGWCFHDALSGCVRLFLGHLAALQHPPCTSLFEPNVHNPKLPQHNVIELCYISIVSTYWWQKKLTIWKQNESWHRKLLHYCYVTITDCVKAIHMNI